MSDQIGRRSFVAGIAALGGCTAIGVDLAKPALAKTVTVTLQLAPSFPTQEEFIEMFSKRLAEQFDLPGLVKISEIEKMTNEMLDEWAAAHPPETWTIVRA